MRTLLLLALQSSLSVQAAKTWATLPVRQPEVLNDTALFYPNTDASIGTPPQNLTMLLDIGSQPLFALTPDCLFCPSEGMYDPSYSSSSVSNRMLYGDRSLAGFRGNETLTLGGILQDSASPLVFIDQMPLKFVPRFQGGHLGLFGPQNLTRRSQSFLSRLDDKGQLLNPVWGLRLGGENPQLTIGALDPNDYEGEINWVPTLGDQPIIQVDALKGYQGNVIPASYPINATLDSMSKNIYIPELDVYMLNTTYVGPQEIINIYPPSNISFAVLCNGTKFPSVEFSVEINGIDYPIRQDDILRNSTGRAADGFCNVGVMESGDNIYVLGLTFLRSVYLAYRFPTGSCPGYWGFATPKHVPLPTATKNQKPKVTPANADTCLAFTAPSSTPNPTIQSGSGGSVVGSTGETYMVYGRPDDPQVELRGVGDLPPLKVAGAIYGFEG